MKTKKLLSLLTAAALSISSFAALTITANAAISIGDEVTTYSESKTFTFENETTGAINNSNTYTVLNNGLVFYPGGNANASGRECYIDSTTDEIGYTARFRGYNGDTGKSVLVFKAGAAGTVSIKAKATGTANRTVRINVGSNIDSDVTTTLQEFETDVAANKTVYISSRSGSTDVAIYEVKYTVGAESSTKTVTFEKGDEATGTAPKPLNVKVDDTFTIPANRTLYVEGKTLTAWTDGTNTYKAGDKVTMKDEITLKPVFTENTVSLGDADGSMTIDLSNQQDGQSIAIQYRKDFLVYQAVVGTQTIDVKVDVDTDPGKINNDGRTDSLAQVNGGTEFAFPVVKNSVVTVGDIYYDTGVYTINGIEKTGDNQSETIPAAGTCTIVAGPNGTESGGYWSTITVTYPKAPSKPGAVTLTGGNVTGHGDDAASIWNGKITATGATYDTITATVTLNEPDENGKTEASNSGAAPTITTEGEVTVYVAVNKAVEDIDTVTLTVE